MADVTENAGTNLYRADEHAWIERQVAALRRGDFGDLDRDNLIEFLNSMALRDERELESWLIVLRAHMIKMQIQPDKAWCQMMLRPGMPIKTHRASEFHIGVRRASTGAIRVQPFQPQ